MGRMSLPNLFVITLCDKCVYSGEQQVPILNIILLQPANISQHRQYLIITCNLVKLFLHKNYSAQQNSSTQNFLIKMSEFFAKFSRSFTGFHKIPTKSTIFNF